QLTGLSAGNQREAEGGQDLVDRLEERGSAGGAVAGAAGGDALGLVAAEPGAAGVAGFGTGVGLGEASDGAFGVVDRLVGGLDGAAVPTRGGAGPADALPDPGGAGAGDRHVAVAVAVDHRRGAPGVVGGDERVVVAREGRSLERAHRRVVR